MITWRVRLALLITLAKPFSVSGQSDSIPFISEECYRIMQVENCISRYRKLCTLRDSNGEISQSSMMAFESLFEQNAKVVNDLGPEPPYLIDMKDYVSNAFNHLEEHGIEAYLADYRYDIQDSDAYFYQQEEIDGETIYTYDVPATKALLNSIDSDGWEENLRLLRIVYVRFLIHYYENSDSTKIAKIILNSNRINIDNDLNKH